VKQVTSFDVARLAGVSQPTVSRALRNLPGASPQTRARILAAAAELAYIPSESGRTLSTSSTHRIAVVSEELTNPYYPELVEPLRRHLAAHDLRTVVVTRTERGPVGLDVLADGSYDGAVLTTTERRSALPRDLTERGIPHVLVNRVLDHAESPSCAVDNAGGARAIATLLADLGHREIASLQGPTLTSTGRERAEGLRLGLRGRGIALPRDRVRRVGFDHGAGLAAALDLLDATPRPTAIVCGNDVLALGALSAARTLGIRVPDQLTVIGFDDISIAGWPLIALTTVRCDLEALARTAIELLVAEIGSPGREPVEVRHPVTLVLRGTHAPPDPAANSTAGRR
jgi:LacI family transcriptional regulator